MTDKPRFQFGLGKLMVACLFASITVWFIVLMASPRKDTQWWKHGNGSGKNM